MPPRHIQEVENDIRRERQTDGIAKARERGVRFGRKTRLVPDKRMDSFRVRRPICNLADISTSRPNASLPDRGRRPIVAVPQLGLRAA